MNLYLLFTRSGNVYAVRAHYSFDAVNEVERLTGEHVSAWDISCGEMPRGTRVIPDRLSPFFGTDPAHSLP